MSFRVGRLRWPDVALFGLGAGTLHILLRGVWAEPEVHPWAALPIMGWAVAAVASIALLPAPISLVRRSQDTALRLEVAVAVLAPLVLILLALRLIVGDAADGAAGWQLPLLLLLTATVAWWAIRDESRGIKPDRTPEPIELALDGAQSQAPSE